MAEPLILFSYPFFLLSQLKQTLTNPEMILEISSQPLLRMFWVKPTCRRVMLALGFLRMGPVLDFRNGKEDINAIKSCIEIFTALTGKNEVTTSRAS